jgi:hypothetical protein
LTEKPKLVAVLIPSGGEHKADMSASLAALISHTSVNGVNTIIISEQGALIFKSRNNMVKNALDHNPDFIFSLDSDVVVPHDTIIRLISQDKDIVGASYCKRVEPYTLLGHPAQPTNFAEGGVVRFALMPGGCMLVKADVYRRMAWPWYFDTIRRSGSPLDNFLSLISDSFAVPLPDNIRGELLANEDFMEWLSLEHQFYNKNFIGNVIGEDYNFCLKAQKFGYDVWCDLDLTFRLAHVGQHNIICARPQETVPIQET